jgi:uncharacterized repeat protein (TIGR02543 family)
MALVATVFTVAPFEDGDVNAYADVSGEMTEELIEKYNVQTAGFNVASADGAEAGWIKTHGGSNEDRFRSVVRTSDGGFAAAGYSNSPDGDRPADKGSTDFIIAKFNANGDKLWMKNYGGSFYDNFESVTQTSDGGFAAAGFSDSRDGDLPGNKGATDFVIAKFDANGNKLWIKNSGGSNDDRFFSVTQTSDGGFAAAGYSKSTDGDLPGNNGYYDFVIAKFDSNGDKLWMKNYGGTNQNPDTFNSIIQTSDGGYAVAGNSYSADGDLPGNKGSYDFIIAKFDADGNKMWIKNYGGSSSDSFVSIIQTSDNSFVASGFSTSSDGDLSADNKGLYDAVIAKFDVNGNKLWIQIYGGTDLEEFYSVIQVADGGYAATGFSTSSDGDLPGNKGESDFLIAKFDTNGDKVWIQTYGGSDYDFFHSIVQAPDGGYVAAGYSTSSGGDLPVNKGKEDFVIAKFNANGNLQEPPPPAPEYTLTFDAAGGAVSPAGKTVTGGQAYGVLPTPTRTGYTFAGWFTAAIGGEGVTAGTIAAGDATIYAHWTADEAIYTIAFNANGGAISLASKTVTGGQAYGVLPTPTRTGYTFAGWFTAATGGAKVSTGTIAAGDATLYAHWQAKSYKATFNANKGKVSGKAKLAKRVKYGSKLGKLKTPKRKGYKFKGWYTKKSGGKRIKSSTKIPAKNTTYYAQWKKKK